MKNILRKTIISLVVVASVAGYPTYAPLPELITKLTAMIVGMFIGEIPVTYANSIFLEIGDTTNIVYISPECSGFILIAVFTLIMFALPNINLKDRMLSFMLIPVIFLMNVMRIVVSLLLGIYTENTTVVTVFHESVGQIMLLIFMIFLMMAYLNKIKYLKIKRG